MNALVAALVFCQGLGALTGAFSSVWSELAYHKAMRDGTIDTAERVHILAIARGLRFGMFLLLVSSLALVIAAYTSHIPLQPALTDSYWTFILCALFVIGISWALARKRISHTLGSTLVFTGWWFLSYISLGLFPTISFGGSLAFFIVSAALFYGVFMGLRTYAIHSRQVA